MTQVITTTFTFRNDGSESIFFMGADTIFISGEYVIISYWLNASEADTFRYEDKKRQIAKLRNHPLMVKVTEEETYV